MKACEACGGLVATEPDEQIAGTLCDCELGYRITPVGLLSIDMPLPKARKIIAALESHARRHFSDKGRRVGAIVFDRPGGSFVTLEKREP